MPILNRTLKPILTTPQKRPLYSYVTILQKYKTTKGYIMAKTIQVADADHKRLKHMATDRGISLMSLINIILDEFKGREIARGTSC